VTATSLAHRSGYIADRIGRRKPVVLAGAPLMLATTLATFGLPPETFPPYLLGFLLSQWGHLIQLDWSERPSSGVSDPLTMRERHVLAKISRGLSNKHIARTFEISPETVKPHVKNIFLKLSVGSRRKPCFEPDRLGCRDASTPDSSPKQPSVLPHWGDMSTSP
jgi:DNA-binding CsgD family transcriptional regulator